MRKNKIFLSIVFAAAFFGVFLFFSRPREEFLEVSFLDVGQGDSILIEIPRQGNILIDAGPDRRILRALSSALPWWERTIDIAVITHPHDDHLGGMADVMKKYKVKEIAYSGVLYESPIYDIFLETAAVENVPLLIIDRPQKINFGRARLEIIYPFSSFVGERPENLNNSSLVIKLVYGETSFLFSGDAEKEAEEKMLAADADLKADVFKAGHHGSDTANSPEFLSAIRPEFAVISVGKNNKFGHPSARVLKRLERAGARIFRTDERGIIEIRSDGRKLEFE